MAAVVAMSVFTTNNTNATSAVLSPSVETCEAEAMFWGCDPQFGGYGNIRVNCTAGTIRARAYLNGVFVNEQWISAGNSYNFYRDNSSQQLKIEVCWDYGYYTWTYI